jgi:hypothetical protein
MTHCAGKKRLKGFITLRRAMRERALGGNTTLPIFLAKQYLGMADQTTLKLPGQAPRDEQGIDLSKLSDAELDQLERIIESAQRDTPPHDRHIAKSEDLTV